MGKKQDSDSRTIQPFEVGTSTGGNYGCNLLTPGEYFAAYGRNLQVTLGPYEAWLRTEAEFCATYSTKEIMVHRYTSFDSFRDAFTKHMAGEVPAFIKIHIKVI